MINISLVIFGGAIGAVLRHGVNYFFSDILKSQFPWGTIAVNLFGCFVIGMISSMLRGATISSQTYLFIGTGILGAFTTFSAFSIDTLRLLENSFFYSASFVLLNVFGCLCLARLGQIIFQSEI